MCVTAHSASLLRTKKRREVRAEFNAKWFEHGVSGYTNHGCRCDTCKSEKAAYLAEYRRRTKSPRNSRDVLAE